jgi:hypothetical protein
MSGFHDMVMYGGYSKHAKGDAASGPTCSACCVELLVDG